MARTLRVTLQIDIQDAPPNLDGTVEDKIDDWLQTGLRCDYPPKFDGLKPDWWYLRVEVADPGDIDDPEWEVLR